MTLLDKLVNNAGLLQERHPTFIGRRPFASAACIAIPDGRDQLIDLVTDQLLSAYLSDARAPLSDEELSKRKVAVQTAANLKPPEIAPIDGRWRQELTSMTVLDDETIAATRSSYLNALRQVMPPLGAPRGGSIPDTQSAGAAQAFEYATQLGHSGTLWVDTLGKAAEIAETDLIGILQAAKETAASWASAELVDKPKTIKDRVVDFPAAAALVRTERRGFLGRTVERVPDSQGLLQVKRAEESQVDATWRNYLRNPQGTAVKFTTAAGVLRGKVDNVLRALEQWTQHSTSDTRRDRQDDVRDRYAYGPDFEVLYGKAVVELGAQLGIADPTAIRIGRHIVRRRQEEIITSWTEQDSVDPAMLTVRLKDAIRLDVKQAFTQAHVYAGIEQILRDWALVDDGQISPDVQEFKTKMLASITDSLVPPALDREIEPMVTVAYPGEQNSRVEERLTDALSTQPSFARYLRLAAPTFVPRAAGNALIISISLVGQGLVDVPDGAQGLNTWVESAFRPDPTDRLAWRQREGYVDAIDFLDDRAQAELLQRLLATAWNGELTGERAESNGTGVPQFRSLSLRFGAADAPSLTISLEDMPFARTLAPLVDAYLRAISSRYLTETDAVSEILRELSRAVPRGFVERRRPSEEELGQHDLFLEFIPELSSNGAVEAESRELRRLQQQLDEQFARGAGQHKRRYQIQEYFDFWNASVPQALRLSFGTLGYGTFAEVIDEIQQARLVNERAN